MEYVLRTFSHELPNLDSRALHHSDDRIILGDFRRHFCSSHSLYLPQFFSYALRVARSFLELFLKSGAFNDAARITSPSSLICSLLAQVSPIHSLASRAISLPSVLFSFQPLPAQALTTSHDGIRACAVRSLSPTTISITTNSALSICVKDEINLVN